MATGDEAQIKDLLQDRTLRRLLGVGSGNPIDLGLPLQDWAGSKLELSGQQATQAQLGSSQHESAIRSKLLELGFPADELPLRNAVARIELHMGQVGAASMPELRFGKSISSATGDSSADRYLFAHHGGQIGALPVGLESQLGRPLGPVVSSQTEASRSSSNALDASSLPPKLSR